MRLLSLFCFALCLVLSATTAFARGGMGSMGSHMSMGGGALGTSAATPGTNSLGTALPVRTLPSTRRMRGLKRCWRGRSAADAEPVQVARPNDHTRSSRSAGV
jgi:hypothetical protein